MISNRKRNYTRNSMADSENIKWPILLEDLREVSI